MRPIATTNSSTAPAATKPHRRLPLVSRCCKESAGLKSTSHVLQSQTVRIAMAVLAAFEILKQFGIMRSGLAVTLLAGGNPAMLSCMAENALQTAVRLVALREAGTGS